MTLAGEVEDVVAVQPVRPDASAMLHPRRNPGEPLVCCQHRTAEETGILM